MAFSNPYAPVITQVSLPFSSPIPGGLTNEKQIHIQGIVQSQSNASGFSINLCEGIKISPNCALHFNPRFAQSCVVRNAMHNGAWGHEEREGGMPIVKGQTFEVIIMVAPSGYFIAVNGRHFTEFKHRLPMDSAKHLHITGDYMKINYIKYEGGNAPVDPYGQAPAPGFSVVPPPPAYAPPMYNPGGFSPAPAGMVMPQHKSGPPSNDILYNPPVPLTHPIPGRLVPNRMILISAIPFPSAKRFYINFQSGPSGNINFHFDVRIVHGNDRNMIVRNTRVSNKWGKEERAISHFPFSPNASFDMIIMVDHREFKVAVNNTHFISYTHRQPLEKSDTLKISGDIRITTVRFQ